MSIGIFYASNKGFAGDVANRIQSKLKDADVFDIKDTEIEKMQNYSKIILVVATHKVGEIQNDLAAKLDSFKELDFNEKTVGLVGLGDALGHGKVTFNNALGKVYDLVKAQGAIVVGFTENKDYLFEKTDSLREGKFPGLALDLPNQSILNESRISNWVAAINF